MRTALLWVIDWRVLVMSYRRFGTTSPSHFEGSDYSKIIYKYYNPLCNKPEERSSQAYIRYILSHASEYFNNY